jgi:hypothetical protein
MTELSFELPKDTIPEHSERITKELLLSKHSQEKYMEHYLGVHVGKGLFKSPLRADRTPTCSFYKNSRGELLMKDFGNGFCGNFISVVMEKYKISFVEALKTIANDFGIVEYKNHRKNPPKIQYSNKILEKTERARINVEIQDFTPYQLRWWASQGITKETLKKFRVFSCKNVFLNNALFANYQLSCNMYGYYGGKKDNEELWRIYRPGQKKFKFISNWTKYMLQGSHMLPKTGETLFITKSLKDVMVLYEMGLPAIAPCSEVLFMHENQLRALRDRFKRIIVFFDNDQPGINGMRNIKKKYQDLEYIYIPRKYCAKDISDAVKLYGKDKVEETLKQWLNGGTKK